MLSGGPAPEPQVATLVELLAEAALTEYRLIFVDGQERETALPYRDLWHRARGLAAGLAARGVERGDRVALLFPTSPAFVQSFFGVILAGAIPVPLYPPVRLGRMEEFHARTARLLQTVSARLVLSDGRLRPLLGQAVRLAHPSLGCLTPDEVASRETLELTAESRQLAVIQFSSGTTVDPKPVALTHQNLLSNVAAIDAFLDTHGGVRTGVSWLPLYHDMGLVGALLEALYHSGDLVLIPPELFVAKPLLWLRAISRHRAEISPAPNFAYGLCLKRVTDADLVGLDLRCWRFALNGAEPVNPAVLRRFSERFGSVGFDARSLMPVYGLSEATLAVTFHPPGRPLQVRAIDAQAAARTSAVLDGTREIVAVGRPLSGVDVAIRGDDGADLPDRQIGRIFVRSPGVMHGYFEQIEATQRAKPDGWLDTGDLGFTAEGELFITGRKKDVIILRGANHPPQAFEETLDSVPGVRTGCCVAIGFEPEVDSGEELALLVEIDGEAPDGFTEVIRSRVTLVTGIRAHTVVLLAPGTLPRTSSGKLRRGEARRQWLAGELKPPRSVGSMRVALEMARGQLEHLRARIES